MICLIVDLFAYYHGVKERLLLSEIAMNIISEIPFIKRLELKQALCDKYEGSSNKMYLALKETL